MYNRIWIAIFIFTLAIPGLASAVPFNIAGPAADNIDNPTPTTVDLITAETGTITDLNVVVNVSRSPITAAASDMTVTITHVDTGTTATLWLTDGGALGIVDLSVTFDDEAVGALPYPDGSVSGTFRPNSPLSVFDGESVSGTWRLTFVDPTPFEFDGDDLTSWSISGDATRAVPEPASLSLLGLGAVALFLRRGQS